MCCIETFVFFDIETTGLPWQENYRTKITELCFVAALKKDIEKTNYGEMPPVSKITLVFNPKMNIHPNAVKMTGLSNELLQYAPTFEKKIDTIVSFLQDLPKPICLVAHNGNKFDYKIILAEFIDANSTLPGDLLCIDSLEGFRHIFNSTSKPIAITVQKTEVIAKTSNFDISVNDLLTDDEDEWPDLNVSTEDWDDIDKIFDSMSDISCEDISDLHPKLVRKTKQAKRVSSNAIHKVSSKEKKKVINGFSLVSLYQQLLKKEVYNSHRAEGDCLMLLECVVAVKNQFLAWAEKSCIKLTKIKPLIRH